LGNGSGKAKEGSLEFISLKKKKRERKTLQRRLGGKIEPASPESFFTKPHRTRDIAGEKFSCSIQCSNSRGKRLSSGVMTGGRGMISY